jgi:hypothetical protein
MFRSPSGDVVLRCYDGGDLMAALEEEIAALGQQ